MKNCKTCNTEFETKDPRKLYCSQKCKNRIRFINSAIQKEDIKIESLPNEVWKDVDGFEGYFQVSNLQRLKRLLIHQKVKRGDVTVNICKPETLIKGSITRFGYLKTELAGENKRKILFIHKIIAKAFIPNPENKPYINHINGIKTDNRLENLEWCTLSENTKHAFKTGLCSSFCKPVICLQSGKIWTSINSACKELKISYKKLVKMIKMKDTYSFYNPGPSTWRKLEYLKYCKR